MSDPNQPDPPITPAQEAAVRRALAKAGGPEPMPDEIADRLDAVIAELAAERGDGTASAAPPTGPTGPPPAGPPPGAPPTAPPPADAAGVVLPMDAAARRRRVRARIVLGAAAASVAVAISAGLLSERGNDDVKADSVRSDSPARTNDEDGDSAGSENKAAEPAPSAAPSEAESSPSSGPGDEKFDLLRVETDEPLRTVHRDRLREDLIALQRITLPHPATADYSVATLTAPAGFRCEPAAYGDGYLVGVMYDGEPAVVAFREPAGSTQEADVLTCGTADVLHSTTIPAE